MAKATLHVWGGEEPDGARQLKQEVSHCAYLLLWSSHASRLTLVVVCGLFVRHELGSFASGNFVRCRGVDVERPHGGRTLYVTRENLSNLCELLPLIAVRVLFRLPEAQRHDSIRLRL